MQPTLKTILSLILLLTPLPALAVDVGKITPDRMLVYKKAGETELRLHVFNPADHKTTDARPAIVFFFGGGWVKGMPEQFYPQCSYLTSRGMVAISAEYRIHSKHMTTPRE